MQNIFSNALSGAISQPHRSLRDKARDAGLAGVAVSCGTADLPLAIGGACRDGGFDDSVRRRFYRFFQHVQLDGAMTAQVVVDLLGIREKPWVLAMDQTSWEFGKATINILMISRDLERHGRSADLDVAARRAGNSNRAGPGCLNSGPRKLSGFLPGYAECGALRF